LTAPWFLAGAPSFLKRPHAASFELPSEVTMPHRPDVSLPFARRSFLSRLGTGLATLGAALGACVTSTYAQEVSGRRWHPARQAEDDWFDKLPGKHRMIFVVVQHWDEELKRLVPTK
jgi:hypothetical protein